MQYLKILLLLVTICIGQNSAAQENRYLSQKDLSKWYKITSTDLSPDGRWVAFNRHYSEKQDTLVLVNTVTNAKKTIPLGKNLQFSANSNWASYKIEAGVHLLDLENDKLNTFKAFTEVNFSASGDVLVLNNSKEHISKLLQLKTSRSKTFTALKAVFLSDAQDYGVVILKHPDGDRLQVIDFKNDFKTIKLLESAAGSFADVHWHPQEKSFTVFRKNKTGASLLFVDLKGEVFTLREKDVDGYTLYTGSGSKFGISKDNQRVFFNALPVAKKAPAIDSSMLANVEIWKADAPWTEVEKPNFEWIENGVRQFCWNPKTQTIVPIESKEQPFSLLTRDQHHAITYTTLNHLPKFKTKELLIDLNLLDLKTGITKQIVDSLPYINKSFCASPEGKYICYFKDKNWWIYDIATESHTNLTKGWEVPVYDIEHDRSGIIPPYDLPYFTDDDTAVLLYDQWDIWEVNSKTGKRKRLTNGKSRNLQFRFRAQPETRVSIYTKLGFTSSSIDLNKDPLLTIKNLDTYAMGLTTLSASEDTTFMVYDDLKTYKLHANNKQNQFVFMQESSDHPTQLMYLDIEKQEVKTIEQSNKHEKRFYNSRSKLITYWQGGRKMHGALYYPVDYDPGKKYPMVVDIYELNSKKLHDYHLPTLTFQQARIEPVDLNLNGYFVLRPDIHYELNAFGISAVNCVGAAVDKAVEVAAINPNAVGLMGVSFGASQAGFMITQTDRYATAIIGNPVTDLVSYSFSYLWFILDSAFSRFENHQWRFSGSFYDTQAAYLANSTVHEAAKMNTPLLTWAGVKDPNIEWTQSRELYQALRRLEKAHVLLVYPEEGHGIRDSIARKDLYRRHLEWYDHYLKGAPKKSWMP